MEYSTAVTVAYISYAVLSIAYGGAALGLLWLFQDMNTKLILLGLLTAIAAIGYGIVTATAMGRLSVGGHLVDSQLVIPGGFSGPAGILMKVAVVLVLAGIARAMLLTANTGATEEPGFVERPADAQ
jgi:hypothetical protein